MKPKAREWWAVKGKQKGRISPRFFLKVGLSHSTSISFGKGHLGQVTQVPQYNTPNETAYQMLAPSTLGEW